MRTTAKYRERGLMAVRWENTDRDGARWWVQVETDMFDYEAEGLVVSIWTENEDPEDEDKRPVQTLVTASPQQAREMAKELCECADHVEQWHRDHPEPRVLDESPSRGQSDA